MKENISLSVVIPAYNVEKYIEKALHSLQVQIASNVEVIVVDDGSKDNTAALTEQFIANQTMGHWSIIKQANQGVSSARNQGLYQAKGEYVFFLDADDYVCENFFEIVFDNISNHHPQILCWHTIKINSKGDVLSKHSSNRKQLAPGIVFIRESLIQKKIKIKPTSALFQKQFLVEHQIEYPINCFSSEDREFFFKSLIKCDVCLYIPDSLSVYLVRQGSFINSYQFRRFDVVSSTYRTINWVDENEHADIVNGLVLQGIIIRYREIIIELALILNRYHDMSIYQAVRRISKDVYEYYGDLHQQVKIEIKLRRIPLSIRIKMALFLFSPTIYIYVRTLTYSLLNRED